MDIIHDCIDCYDNNKYSYEDYLLHYKSFDIRKYIDVFKSYITENIYEIYSYFDRQEENTINFIFNENNIIITTDKVLPSILILK